MIFARSIPLMLTLALLSACADGKNPFARSPDTAQDTQGEAALVAPATSVKLVDRDVEAPDVFQVTDMGLWDGRPSLGGVWVASPDATDPERVIMRNPANGKFVIGALFKRERENPGPTLQISSDAAEALGLLAGQPARINVTALRREEAPVATDAAKPLLDSAETVQTESLAQGDKGASTAEKVATAPLPATAAAASQAKGTAAAAEKPADKDKSATKTADKAAAKPTGKSTEKPVEAAAVSNTAANAKTPPQPAAKGQDDGVIAETAAAAIAAASGAGAAAATTQIVNAAPKANPPAKTAKAAAPAAQPAKASASASAAASAAPAAPAADGGQYIQIGLFAIEANAKRAVAALFSAGVSAQIRQETSKGKVFYSVGAMGDAGVLSKIKAAGFKDAYPLKR